MSESALAATMREAMRIRAQMRVDGLSVDECNRQLEGVLRTSWPFTREWHYVCDACRDTGWEERACVGTGFCGLKGCHRPHDYVQVCLCAAGRKHLGPATTETSELATIGKSKPRGFTRYGR